MLTFKRYFPEIGFILIWAILLVLPHFQESPSIILLCSSLIVFAALNFIISRAFVTSKYQINRAVYIVIVLSIILTLLLTTLEINTPYLLFSRLGSFSMFLDGKLIAFGDLIHLTSALKCGRFVEVGSVYCDPWNRSFNQNPDAVYIIKFLPVHSHFILGLASILLISSTLFLLLRRYAPSSPLVWLMCLTPPMVLAIDRGNETITIGLIALSIYIWFRNSTSYLFLLPLFLAGIFKVWPLFFLAVMIILIARKNYVKFLPPFFLLAAYVGHRFSDFRKISAFTQQGSELGGSFGWMFFRDLNLYSLFALFASAILGLWIVNKTTILSMSTSIQFRSNPWIFSLMATYIFIFFSGSHFTYRLIILIPLAILINGIEGSRPLQVLIFTLLLTSRLSVVIVTTSALCLVFFALILSALRTRNAQN